MSTRLVRAVVIPALLLGVWSGFINRAEAADFKSIGAAPAILYDAPSERGRRVFVAPRNMPVEVVLTYNQWSKVRDADGDLSWVESKALSNLRMLIVSAAKAQIHAAADETSAVLMVATKGVLLEPLELGRSDWLRVRYRDGQTGYVKASEVWGD